MAKFCQICGKGVLSGNTVSHSHRKGKRTWAPNIQRTRLMIGATPTRVDICTRCLRSMKTGRTV